MPMNKVTEKTKEVLAEKITQALETEDGWKVFGEVIKEENPEVWQYITNVEHMHDKLYGGDAGKIAKETAVTMYHLLRVQILHDQAERN